MLQIEAMSPPRYLFVSELSFLGDFDKLKRGKCFLFDALVTIFNDCAGTRFFMVAHIHIVKHLFQAFVTLY